MYSQILIIAIIASGVASWSNNDLSKEENAEDSFFESGINEIINFVDEGIEGLTKSVLHYADKKQEEILITYEQYVTSIKEEKQKISEEIESYVQKIAETGRQFIDAFDDSNDDNNPEVYLTVPEIIAYNDYLCETHTVFSEGYVLNLFRIPKSKSSNEVSKKTVLLQHGLGGSSMDWILNRPGKGLAYVLADEGYDVWISNARGNRYSRSHLYYKIDSEEYWNFSWHDIAVKDIPNIIDYIIETKGTDTKIAYMGHSMGTTILFVMLTLRPEYNSILSAGYALAPVAFFKNFLTPAKSLTFLADKVAYVEKLRGSYEINTMESFLGEISAECTASTLSVYACKNLVFYLVGYNEEQFNKSLLRAFVSHAGIGISWMTIKHFAQLHLSGKFQQFEYGRDENLAKYGSHTPPEYDLSKITLPITLIWSKNDLFSSEDDVKLLDSKLPNNSRMYMVPDTKFNHLDYMWAIDIKTLLNDKVLEFLNVDLMVEEFEYY